jgi:hypothetical protein
MSEKQSIGLAEFIKQVKTELLTPSDAEDIPLLNVDSVELELQVAVKKEDGGKIGFNLSVLTGEAADKLNKEQVQTVKVTLSPLLDKEKLLALYLKKNPDKKDLFIEQSIEGGTKKEGELGAGL